MPPERSESRCAPADACVSSSFAPPGRPTLSGAGACRASAQVRDACPLRLAAQTRFESAMAAEAISMPHVVAKSPVRAADAGKVGRRAGGSGGRPARSSDPHDVFCPRARAANC